MTWNSRLLNIAKYTALSIIISVIIGLSSFAVLYWQHLRLDADNEYIAEQLSSLGNYEVKYVHEMIEGNWDTVCILTPYQRYTHIGVHSILEGIKLDNDKIFYTKVEMPDLSADDSLWHLILKKRHSGNHKVMRLSRLKKLYPKQKSFSETVLDNFTKIGFTPRGCVDFKDAMFLRYDLYYNSSKVKRNGVVLGEMKE